MESLRLLKRIEILKGFNLAAMIICISFFLFLTLGVQYSQYYFVFLSGAVAFAFNQYLIIKGRFALSILIFMFLTNGLMLIFDDGMFSPTRSFMFYIPLLLGNTLITNFEKPLNRILPIAITILCISISSFTDLTPKIAAQLYNPQHQLIVGYFNTYMAITISFIVGYILNNSVSEARLQLKESKNILSKNEKLLESINQNIDIGIFRLAADTNEVLYVNNAILKLFQSESLEEIKQNSTFSYYTDYTQYERVKNILKQEKAIRNVEVKLKRKNGAMFWGLLSCYEVINEDGERVIDGSLRDITQIKQLQEELIAAKEAAEKSSLAKSQFLSIMSHEIRTPMNAVIGASNLLLQDEPRKEQMDYLLLLKSAGANLMRLINNILDFSKIELNKIEFERIGTDLVKLAEEVINSHYLEGQRKELKVELISTLKHTQFLIDPIRFTQILNNLISNAIKFTEQGSVKVSLQSLSETEKISTIQITVSDTGIGISEHRQSQIFNSFSQENIDTTRKYGGSGLGLAITRKIIEKMGSTITLKSKKGEGSTFSFIVPLTKHYPNYVISENIAHRGISLKGMRVLVVEDNKMNTYVLSKFLTKWGVDCEACENGREAIKLIKKNNYNLVLMDLHMPDMDGFEATQQIRLFNTEIPIFAITADAFSETRQKALLSGMNDFIAKPFDPKELFNKAAALQVNLT